MENKVIISCAVTGSIHTPTMSKHLPITADEIAEQAIDAAKAGAAVLHLHTRDPENGKPSQDPDLYAPFLKRIHNECDAVINITTGGSPHMPIEERLQPLLRFKPELASLNLGSMNFGIFTMLNRFKEFKYEWEKEHLENSKDRVFKNTFTDIETILAHGAENGTRFEFECYDISHLYTLAYYVDQGLVEYPFIQSVFGILGGIGPTAEDLMHMRRTADKLFGDQYQWSILAAGRSQMPLATIGAITGSNVRVGLEDSLWTGPGKMSQSNAEQVSKIRRILEELNLEIATPDEAREKLRLKGKANVNI